MPGSGPRSSSSATRILTGYRKELLASGAGHMDVNATILCGGDQATREKAQTVAADNVKRAIFREGDGWLSADRQHPYLMLDTQEIKTTWHPIGN